MFKKKWYFSAASEYEYSSERITISIHVLEKGAARELNVRNDVYVRINPTTL